jgi:thiol-disulfide isomerase/thioredoxin
MEVFMTRRFGRPGSSKILAMPAVLFLSLPTAAFAAPLVCKPTYDYAVEVEGTYPKDALFYRSNEQGKYFIDIPACKDGLLMDLMAKKILAVPRERVSRLEDDLQVRDGAPAQNEYAMSVEGPIVEFRAEDKKVRILPVLMRPPINGPVAFDALLEDRPEYRAGMKSYTPDAASIAAIGKYARRVEIEAYFATWCSHCKDYMPKFLRVMQDAKNPKIKLILVGVPKNFGKEPGLWQGKVPPITSIPAIIVKVDGKEITRLGTQPGSTPEIELAETFQAVR